MNKAILGKKIGMSQIFTDSGLVIPVTVVEAGPCQVSQIKTVEKDGYSSVQLAFVDAKASRISKAEAGHLKKANTEPKRFLKEIRGVNVNDYTLGQVLKAEDVFTSGESVDVTGTSKGKGFQGVINRWNHSRGPMGHGSQYHRGVGSLGTMLPMHVIKGKKMPGHMGNVQRTVQNLEVVSIDTENNVILIKGNIPGPKKSYVVIRDSVKTTDKEPVAYTLLSYAEEAAVEETPVEETVVEEVAATEEQPVEENVVEETTTEEVAETEEQPAEEKTTEE